MIISSGHMLCAAAFFYRCGCHWKLRNRFMIGVLCTPVARAVSSPKESRKCIALAQPSGGRSNRERDVQTNERKIVRRKCVALKAFIALHFLQLSIVAIIDDVETPMTRGRTASLP